MHLQTDHIVIFLAYLNVVALLGNAAWSIYNGRMENRILHRIDGLKDWIAMGYHNRDYCAMRAAACEEWQRQIQARLERAGA